MVQIIRISTEDKIKRLNDLQKSLKAHRANLDKSEVIGFDRACSVIHSWMQLQNKLLGEYALDVSEELANPHL